MKSQTEAAGGSEATEEQVSNSGVIRVHRTQNEERMEKCADFLSHNLDKVWQTLAQSRSRRSVSDYSTSQREAFTVGQIDNCSRMEECHPSSALQKPAVCGAVLLVSFPAADSPGSASVEVSESAAVLGPDTSLVASEKREMRQDQPST
uniref:Uncharacterized protein n=1 Tax=Knipowitschia caucasica TaxID=637954 RepID=A0AAV2LKU0_KNICA